AWQCLPIDVSLAISNLIFAASRCGDLPELHMLRSLKPVQKAEVLDLEIQDIFSDSDESSMPASKFRTPTKTESLYNDLDRSSTDRLGRIQSRNKKNEVLIRNLEASATSISSYGILPIHQASVIYLDTIEVKSLSQSHSSMKQ
ncbi:hypothetical protein OIU85_022368, partial [Salix viminalis]